jgi:hypothetical protein
MNETVIELVKLENGDIVLRRRGDDNSEPLLRMQFSEQAQEILAGNELNIAQLMVHAGIQGVEQIQNEAIEDDEKLEHRFLH